MEKEKVKKKKSNPVVTILIILFIVIIFDFLIGIPLGSSKYLSKNGNVNLEVPRFSKFNEECCMFNITFNSFRSVNSLEKDMKKILNSYEKIECTISTSYYNKENDYTITSYSIKHGFPWNKISITYDKGKYSCE